MSKNVTHKHKVWNAKYITILTFKRTVTLPVLAISCFVMLLYVMTLSQL